jgi:hypothetical protein
VVVNRAAEDRHPAHHQTTSSFHWFTRDSI